ncbi:MAG: molybdopterin-dependent oxidoreductase [Acidimicrobiia bacterium]|nr:molybdopterin-dependent oxidoreductase [Acidimicrobiia bacterium]
MTDTTSLNGAAEWSKTACILCECACGIEVKLEDRQFVRIRGNKEHVESKGYTCEKALRLDHYQNNRGRLTSPMRRTAEGTYEEIDWDTAIAEVAGGLGRVRDAHGAGSIFRYGGTGQTNHLFSVYGQALADGIGVLYESNSIAQEKTGEVWVEVNMLGAHTRPELSKSEVAIFVGKNPWQSHSFPAARRTLKAIANDPERALIVFDPKRTKTAELADFHIQLRPGTDAFCIAAILGILVRDELVDTEFLDRHVTDRAALVDALRTVPIDDYATRCDVPVAQLEAVAQRLSKAKSIGSFEDLGIEQGPNSTLVSYLQRLLWVLNGSFAKPGANQPHSWLGMRGSRRPATPGLDRTPVTGARVITGLVPCNSIPEEILTDHPDRFRAMIIESSNPVHSLADSKKFREAMRALEFSVVIDVAMTETARQADIVLPASSAYEKCEASFFTFHFPDNVFYLRKPIVEPLPGTLAEPEIYARIAEKMGLYDLDALQPLVDAAKHGRSTFAHAYAEFIGNNPPAYALSPLILYRTLGPTLPAGLDGAAALWELACNVAEANPVQVERAGSDPAAAESLGGALFDRILESDDGVVFTQHDYDEVWDLMFTWDEQLRVDNPEMIEKLLDLSNQPTDYRSDEFPLILAAGERRSFTANVIIRDPDWRKNDRDGALHISQPDADSYGLENGDRIRVVTATGSAEAMVEVTDTMREGHIALPNGFGLEFPDEDGEHRVVGVSPNELTALEWRDDFAGTPWHKHVPARLETIAAG